MARPKKGSKQLIKTLTEIMDSGNSTINQKLEAARILAMFITKPKLKKEKEEPEVGSSLLLRKS